MADRLSTVEIARILDVSGVRALDHDSTKADAIKACVTVRRLIRHAPIHDVALVYAALVQTAEVMYLHLPIGLEDMFFKPIYLDLYHGKIREDERSQLRKEDRSLDEEPGDPGGSEPHGDTAGEFGGRNRRVEIVVPQRGERLSPGSEDRDPGEVQEDPEPVERTARSGRLGAVPF